MGDEKVRQGQLTLQVCSAAGQVARGFVNRGQRGGNQYVVNVGRLHGLGLAKLLNAFVGLSLSDQHIPMILQCRPEFRIDKHCLAVQPGEGRLLKCLKSNASDISAQCTTALKDTGLWDRVP